MVGPLSPTKSLKRKKLYERGNDSLGSHGELEGELGEALFPDSPSSAPTTICTLYACAVLSLDSLCFSALFSVHTSFPEQIFNAACICVCVSVCLCRAGYLGCN